MAIELIREGNLTSVAQFHKAVLNIINSKEKPVYFVDNLIPRFTDHLIKALSMLDSINDETAHRFAYISSFQTLKELLKNTKHNTIIFLYTTSFDEVKDYLISEQNCKDMPAVLVDFAKDMKSDKYDVKAFVTKKENTTIVCANRNIPAIVIFKTFWMHFEWHKTEYSSPVNSYAKLLKAQIENNISELHVQFEKIANCKETRLKNISSILYTFEENKEARLEQIKKEINSLKNTLNQLQREYVDCNETINEKLAVYECIVQRKEDIDKEAIQEYLINNQYFRVCNPTNKTFEMHYKTPILDYDPEKAEMCKLHRVKEMQDILNIFSNYREKYQLWTHCALSFSPRNGDVQILQQRNYSNGCIGHPHLNEYGCKGNHPDKIISFTNQGNFIGAMNAITAMVFNLNFKDGIVVDGMLNTLLASAHFEKCKTWKDLETNEFKTTAQVLEEIKKEENNGEAETE